jgi:shikimate dehydrogenase
MSAARDAGSWPTATTHAVGIIGDPIRHSLSPVLHNAAFAALGLDWAYLAFEVAEGAGSAAVTAVRALGLEGLSVTMPHKADAAGAVDRLSPTAERLGVVNTVVRRGSLLLGESTDGDGFIDALRADRGFDPAGRRCVILGAGGAARAVVLALAEAGAAEVVVVGRTPSRAEGTAALAGSLGRVGVAEDASEADLVVNATPVGMEGTTTSGLPVDPRLLGGGQLVADLIYAPAVTAFLEAARARGAATVNGLGMLVHQAGRQFHLWTGNAAPLDAMSAAALAAIAAQH